MIFIITMGEQNKNRRGQLKMSESYISNIGKLVEQLSRFTYFVQHMDGKPGFISFRDGAGFLGREEDYKSRIAEEARKALNAECWKESWIGTGKIAACAAKAMGRADNLVNKNQQIDFKNRLNPEHPNYHPEAEQVLYDIYKKYLQEEEPVAFSNAVKTFGAKYDTIAFLFFVKDYTRFLPISTGHFDKAFNLLDIDYSMSYKCSWKNYQGFIKIISEIRTEMEDMLPMQGTPRLIDAHSFVWVIQEEKFIEWVPNDEESIQIEQVAEEHIQAIVTGTGGRRSANTSPYIRSAEVTKETRKRANGVCQYCNQPAPFLDKKGNPYLEVHHIIWLSRGGADSTDNTVALCPNCHTRMHVLDDPEDVMKLKKIIEAIKGGHK